MGWPFSFRGEIGRVAYAIAALATFVSQHLAALILLKLPAQPERIDLQFLLIPLRSPFWPYEASWIWWFSPFAALPLTVLVAWALAALSFRRATNANADPWIAAASVVPVVQIPAILFLCLAPSRTRAEAGRTMVDDGVRVSWAIAMQGMLAGATFTVASVALGALVFGTYGYGMFVLSPLMIGVLTGYLANRQHDIGMGSTAGMALGATGLGGIALVVMALEGILCLALAAPLTLGLALLGGALGREIANSKRATTLGVMSVALLPLAFGVEREFPTVARFESYQSIEVAAPREFVWEAIVRMEPIDSPSPFLFQFGVAYPVDGELAGSGVGALRRGVFSTGAAMERVTAWVENERFGLEVLSNARAQPIRQRPRAPCAGLFRYTDHGFWDPIEGRAQASHRAHVA